MPADPVFWGTLPGWITAISTSGLAGGLFWAAVKAGLVWRSQSLKAEAGIRDHYAKELAGLREERAKDHTEFAQVEKHLRDMLNDSENRHIECEKDRRAMRAEMAAMDRAHTQEIYDLNKKLGAQQREIDGLKRQISRYSADALVILEDGPAPKPSSKAPDAAASAPRVKKITEGK